MEDSYGESNANPKTNYTPFVLKILKLLYCIGDTKIVIGAGGVNI